MIGGNSIDKELYDKPDKLPPGDQILLKDNQADEQKKLEDAYAILNGKVVDLMFKLKSESARNRGSFYLCTNGN